MCISDWSSDVCSSEPFGGGVPALRFEAPHPDAGQVAQDHVEPRMWRADPFVLQRARARPLRDQFGHAVATTDAAATGPLLVPLRDSGRCGRDRKGVVWGQGVSVSVILGGRVIL